MMTFLKGWLRYSTVPVGLSNIPIFPSSMVAYRFFMKSSWMGYGVKGKGKLRGGEGEVSPSHEVMETSMLDVTVTDAPKVVVASTIPKTQTKEPNDNFFVPHTCFCLIPIILSNSP